MPTDPAALSLAERLRQAARPWASSLFLEAADLIESLQAETERLHDLERRWERQGWRAEAEQLQERLAATEAVASEQAEDDGLWFVAQSAPEAYLQQELRRLHAIIEGSREVET